MNRRGFSLIELLIVVVIIGTVATVAIPMVRRGMEARRIAGSLVAITSMNAKARAIAVQQSRTVMFVVNGNTIRILSRHPVTGASTVVDSRDLNAVYSVTVTSSADTLRYDPRGLGLQNGSTTITVARPERRDSVVITSLGGILR